MKVPYARQSISEEDIDAVVEVLRSDFLTQGPEIEKLESAVEEYCGGQFGIAVSSGTAGLHIACLGLGIGEGDLVWTSPNSFVASANCALYCGAEVDFVDIDRDTLNLSADALEEKLIEAEKAGKLPSLVIPVHFGGLPCDMERIWSLAETYGFRVLEDASHAIGARYGEGMIGNCRYSHACVFSFHPVKIITSGEGGFLLCRDQETYDRAKRARMHGITRERNELVYPDPGEFYYEQLELGYNYRITDFQAALGRSQLGRIDQFVERRRDLADQYHQKLSSSGLTWQSEPEGSASSYHLFVVRCDSERVPIDRNTFFSELRKHGVLANLHYIPIYLHPYYRERGFLPGYCVEAERYYNEAVSLPMFFELTSEELDHVVTTISSVLER